MVINDVSKAPTLVEVQVDVEDLPELQTRKSQDQDQGQDHHHHHNHGGIDPPPTHPPPPPSEPGI